MTDHDPDTDVPTCESDAEVGDARSAAVEAGRPLLYVKARGEYAFVEADMEPADVRLDALAVADAADLVREAKEAANDETDPDATPATASADPRGVTVGPLAVPDAEAVAADLAPVVFDETNWTPA
jgi:hypothetical protein